MADDTEEAVRKKEAEAEERRKESHNMVAESIRRELLESASSSYPTMSKLIHDLRGEGSGGPRRR